MDLMLTDAPVYYAGGGFPWGLLILGGIAYFLWTKGVFDGRGRFGNGGRFGGSGYGAGYGSAGGPEGSGYGPGAGAGQESGPGFTGPRAMFEEWHRQAHEAPGTPPHTGASSTPSTPATSAAAPADVAAPAEGDAVR